jgi:hypothetical protein
MYTGKQLRNVSEEIVAHNLNGVYIDSSWITMKIGAKTLPKNRGSLPIDTESYISKLKPSVMFRLE